MSEWPVRTIAECAAPEPYSTQIGPFGKALMAKEYTESGFPVLRGVNVNRGRFYDDGFVYIGEETADRLAKFESYPGDVLLVHKGTLGQIGLMPERRRYSRYIMGNSMMRVRCDPTILLPEYLYYWLSSSEGQHYLFSRVSQVGVPQIQTPLTTLRQAALPIPPLPDQHRIAHILGTLDDKIELNRRMNRALEEIARAIFKSWFIDFDPVIDNAILNGKPIPDEFTERAEVRREILARSQPSPPSPLPEVEGRNYRGGFEFAGLVERARELRQKQTPTEEILWELVRDRRFLDLKFRRQHQIGDYIADFYCDEHKLVIEVDGGIHRTQESKDAKRDAYMESLGLTVLRFQNTEVLDSTETVLAQIAGAMDVRPSPFGRGRGEGVAGYRHLFPDSFQDSALGEIPKGWNVSTVGHEFRLTMGQSPPGSTYNEDGDGLPFFQGRRDFGFRFPTKRVFCTAPKRIAEAGDTLVTVRAPVGDVNMAPEQLCVGRGLAGVCHASGSRSYTHYSMLSLRDRFREFESEGTVFGAINKNQFAGLQWIAPPTEIVGTFEVRLFGVDETIRLNEMESMQLASVRDALLPVLLTGQIGAGFE